MKKIMFNDKYGLTKAVEEGRKTQTRRIEFNPCHEAALTSHEKIAVKGDQMLIYFKGVVMEYRTRYRIFEDIAIAKNYKEAGVSEGLQLVRNGKTVMAKDTPGWANKMFVKPELMPDSIMIVGIGAERLNDISEEDCMEEGIYKTNTGEFTCDGFKGKTFGTAKEAYAELIDKISGKGTWDSNPWVVVYKFEYSK